MTMHKHMLAINVSIVFFMLFSFGMFILTVKLMGAFGRHESPLADQSAMFSVISFFTATILSVAAILLGRKWEVSSMVARSNFMIQLLIVLYSIWAINA